MKYKKIITAAVLLISTAFIINLLLFFLLREDALYPQASAALRNSVIFLALLLFTITVAGIINHAQGKANICYFKNLYDGVLEKSDVGMAVINTSNQLDFASRQFRELMQMDLPTDSCGHLTNILPEPARQLIEEYRTTFGEPSDAPLSKTLTFDQRYIHCTIFCTEDTENNLKFIFSAQDHTARVNMEKKLKEQMSEIQYYSDAKESLLANISHELKTPLNAIIGLNHILQRTNLDAKQKEIASKINTSSDFLLSLINDILDFSKITNGSLSMYPSRFKLHDLLTDIGKIFYPTTAQKGIAFQEAYTFNTNLCLYLDRLRLEQVLVNLINNACKFTETGYVKVSISVLHELPETITLRFSVEDTGIGIDFEDIPDLFTAFHQLENHMTKLHQGTGLGLSICRRLVENMGGTLNVDSKKGIGAAFSFTLTVPKCYDVPAITVGITPPATLRGHGEKILVVEDTLINYEVVEDFLSAVNIACEHASSGAAAIKMCAEAPPNYYAVILMDVYMPQMDGYETSKALRASGITAPIIIMTAGNIDDATKAQYPGLISEVIFKPFKCSQLYDKLLPFINYMLDPAEEDPYAEREKAVENLGGDPAFYEKHLNRFKKSYAKADQAMKTYVETGRPTDAQILSHSIKGLAAMLGLPYLETASANLEQAINSNNENISFFLSAFSDKLQAVITGE